LKEGLSNISGGSKSSFWISAKLPHQLERVRTGGPQVKYARCRAQTLWDAHPMQARFEAACWLAGGGNGAI
jgi:hypothetical protein